MQSTSARLDAALLYLPPPGINHISTELGCQVDSRAHRNVRPSCYWIIHRGECEEFGKTDLLTKYRKGQVKHPDKIDEYCLFQYFKMSLYEEKVRTDRAGALDNRYNYVTGFWKTADQLQIVTLGLFQAQLMATLVHYTYTVPLLFLERVLP